MLTDPSLDPERLLQDRIAEAETDRPDIKDLSAARAQVVARIREHPIYLDLKKGLETLENYEGSTVEISEDDDTSCDLDAPALCILDTNIDDPQDSDSTLEIDFTGAGLYIPNAVAGLEAYRTGVPFDQVYVGEILTAFYDSAIDESMIPIPDKEEDYDDDLELELVPGEYPREPDPKLTYPASFQDSAHKSGGSPIKILLSICMVFAGIDGARRVAIEGIPVLNREATREAQQIQASNDSEPIKQIKAAITMPPASQLSEEITGFGELVMALGYAVNQLLKRPENS